MIKPLVFLLLFALYIYYSALVYSSGAGEEYTMLSPEAVKGKSLFQQHNCISCHQVYRLGGYLGPELTDVYSRRSRSFIKGILLSGTAVMPDYGLSEADADAICHYLDYLDRMHKIKK